MAVSHPFILYGYRLAGFGLLNQGLEGIWIGYGDLGQHLAVDVNAVLFEGIHQLAIGNSVLAGGGVDARDPQAAQVALFVAAIAIGIEQALQLGFVGALVKLGARAELALGDLEDCFVPLAAGSSCFYA